MKISLFSLKVWPYPIQEDIFFIVDSYVKLNFLFLDMTSAAFRFDLQVHDMKAVTWIPRQSSVHPENSEMHYIEISSNLRK